MIGAFPPPMHGMASVNLAIKNYFLSNGENPAVINIAASSLDAGFLVRLMRGAKVFLKLLQYFVLLLSNRSASVYISISAGFGQLYEILFISIARFCGKKLYLHHHSFVYIYRHSFLTELLIMISGRGAQHIVLCDDMSLGLTSQYPLAVKSIVISNTAFIPVEYSNKKIKNKLKILGFLSNIDENKGIYEFLDVVEMIGNRGLKMRAIIAGPFRDMTVKQKVLERIKRLSNVCYVGPKYGLEKNIFFESIDVLLYPTRNDAEPLTILEAMAGGVPVIARSRGCIDSMLTSDAGIVIDWSEDYVEKAYASILDWSGNQQLICEKSIGALKRYQKIRESSLASLEILFNNIVH